MKYNGIKWTIRSPFFVYCRKHFCPDCDELLQRIWVSRIVNSKSLEGQYYDFSAPEGITLYGDVKFVWLEFICPFCGRSATVGEMLAREKRKWYF